MKKKAMCTPIPHEQLWLRERQHMIDIHVLSSCRLLWVNGIETFYSCQGGPTNLSLKRKKIYFQKAYVQVLKRDGKKACKLLSDLNPKIETGGDHKDRVCIRFNYSDEAVNINLGGNHEQ